jgi:hypothetical protein
MVLQGGSRLLTGLDAFGTGFSRVQVTLGVILLAAVPLILLVGPLNKRRSRRRAARAALGEGPASR